MSNLRCDYCGERFASFDSVKDGIKNLQIGELKVDRIGRIEFDCGRCYGRARSDYLHMWVALDLVKKVTPPVATERPYKVGDVVLHSRFGTGQVEQIGLAPLVTVRFRGDFHRNPITLNESDLFPRICGVKNND